MDSLIIAPPTLASTDQIVHLIWGVFIFCFGACVGSFRNVVLYRMPKGLSLLHPPSQCPLCDRKLRFLRENTPILGWIVLRGRCRFCRTPISPQYVIVETLLALAFLGVYIGFFVLAPDSAWWRDVSGVWWITNGFMHGWPAFMAILCLFAGLIAMTVIDARTCTIPIQIPVFVTVVAFVLAAVQSLLYRYTPPVQSWPIPGVSWFWLAVCGGAGVGLAINMLRLRVGAINSSFADYEDYLDDGETLADYPHARREMSVELRFLLPCIIGAVIGGALGHYVLPITAPPLWVQAVGATLAGYLAGGGIVWLVRILGTLAFGREAMGLGDVHLLAAVGAVLGWFDPILIFFMAPFFALLWTAVAGVVTKALGGPRHELPYGPHLALATVVLILCRPLIDRGWSVVMPGVSMPTRGLVEDPPDEAVEATLNSSAKIRLPIDWTERV
jgi:leader peptidase (prepilin peptidase)/N-methyltransferase